MLRCSVILALVALLGCSNPPLSPVYDTCYDINDTCYDINDCVETATLCEELGVDFGGFTYTNSICTLPCETEGALSPDCPRAWVGRFGSCYPSNVAGGIDDTLICFVPYRRKRRDLRTWPLLTLLRLPAQTRATPLE
jgi:hypothetical protein